jgi:hypothetical protein
MQLHLVDDSFVSPKPFYLLVSTSSTRCFIFFDGGSRKILIYQQGIICCVAKTAIGGPGICGLFCAKIQSAMWKRSRHKIACRDK